MMQHTDSEIDLALDDREPELVYEASVWTRLFNAALLSLLLPTFGAMWADVTGRRGLLVGSCFAFCALVAVVVFALVMQYREDHRAPEVGGHGA
ncbi:hypothetical protein [Micromonospora sp. NPDC051006]|uniref:hypothetical protein n=1 Tax=Micromonospora sp. NPDC051006 TaxID=3364283 RepID=UPI0037B5293E